MSGNKALNGRYGHGELDLRAPRPERPTGAALPPEAELLRVIEKALEEQRRARALTEAPLSSRIEAILSPKFEAANDVAPVAQPAAESNVMPQSAARELPPANTHPVALADFDDQPDAGIRRPLIIVTLAAILGAAIPLLLPQAPVRYTAETSFKIGGDTSTRPTLTAAAAKKLLSGPVVASTVSSLKLDRDPEFIGGQPNATGVIFDLLSGSGTATDAASRAEASLAAAIEAVPDLGAGLVDLKVSTSSAAKSRQIAARLSEVVTAVPAGGATEAENTLRKAYDQARSELDAFVAKSGEGNVKVASDLQRQINQLDADLKIAEQRIALSKEQVDRLKAAKANDIVSGVLPSDMMSPALQDARDRYAAEKATLSQLSTDLGPRHPKLLAQQAIVDGLWSKLSDEISRQLKQAGAEAKAAVDARRKLNDSRNILIAQSRDTGVDFAKLTEMRDKAESAKSRLDETRPSDLPVQDITVQATPKVSATSSGYGLSLRSAVGGMAGLGLGLVGILAALFRNRPDREVEAPEVPVPVRAIDADETPDETFEELELLRAELRSLRSRLHTYAANSA